jgi:hypothetical protein
MANQFGYTKDFYEKQDKLMENFKKHGMTNYPDEIKKHTGYDVTKADHKTSGAIMEALGNYIGDARKCIPPDRIADEKFMTLKLIESERHFNVYPDDCRYCTITKFTSKDLSTYQTLSKHDVWGKR